MKTNILYISYDGMTDPLGQSQVLPYLIGLSKEEYTFHLISFEKKDRFLKNKKHIQEICDKAGIVWHPLKYTKNPPLLSTIYDVQRMKRLAYRLHKKHPFKIVHCRSYISALVGIGMKKKFGVKFLFDMRGFWADERVDGHIWNMGNPIFRRVYHFFKKKELQFFSEADYTISLTQTGKDEIENWEIFKDKKSRIEIIPCCVDLELFNPTKIDKNDQDSLRKLIKISSDEFILGYIGSIGTWYLLPEMLEYFKSLKKVQPSARFLFVTTESSDVIREKAISVGIQSQDILVTSCLHSEMPLYISLFTASVFFIRPSYSKKASSPTKQGELMAMGIPLICNAGVGDTDSIVLKYSAGIVLPAMNEVNYTENTSVLENFNKEKTMLGAREFFSLEKGVQKYKETYQRILR